MKTASILFGIIILGTIIVSLLSCSTNKSSTTANTPQIDSNIAYKVVEKLIEKKLINFDKKELDKAWADKHDPKEIEWFPEYKDPGYLNMYFSREYTHIYCLPYNRGGYYIIKLSGESGCDPDEYRFFNYKDGKIERDNNYPKPTLKDFYANADKFPSEAINFFSSLIAEHSYYMDYVKNKLIVHFIPFEYEYRQKIRGHVVPASLRKFFYAKQEANNQYANKKGPYKLPKVIYIWNGEEFVRDPENKPYEEDLSLFE